MPSPGVDTSTPGRYVIHYYAEDAAGHHVSTSRTVVVEEDPKQPLIRLLGDPDITVEAGDTFEDPGILLEDYLGTALEPNLVVVGNRPDGSETGDFTVTYNFTDPEGHIADEVTRIVRVVDTTPPDITLVGASPVTLATGGTFIDPGATVTDGFDPAPVVFSNVHFPKDGLVLHLDASTISGQTDGTQLNGDWNDLSGNDNHMDNQAGDPLWKDNVLNGHAVVEYDGNDLTWTNKDFESDLTEYSVISVARYISGTHARVISSRSRNWVFGFSK